MTFSVWTNDDYSVVTTFPGTERPHYADGRPMEDCTRKVRTFEAESWDEATKMEGKILDDILPLGANR